MDNRSLLNRLQHEKAALEHPQALDKFLRETEYLREKPARRHFSGSKAGCVATIASLSVGSAIAVAILSLLR